MALIPPFFLDAVVAIGILTGDATTTTTTWVASGFLYGVPVNPAAAQSERQYRVFLVTNRHVLEGYDALRVRFNPQEAKAAVEYDLPLKDAKGTRLWLAHNDPEVDVGAVSLNVQLLKDHKIAFNFFAEDLQVANRAKAKELGVSEGDVVYALGFPMGLVGGERSFVIVRQGAIARIKDALAGTAKEFLIDATVFPGNSGGPVVNKPELVAIEGTTPVGASYLLGVVKSYVPYLDVAVSAQTKRPRVTFEENSGLTSVVPMDFVQEVIHETLKTVPTAPSAPSPPTH